MKKKSHELLVLNLQILIIMEQAVPYPDGLIISNILSCLLLAIISIFLTIKAFSNEESSTIENVILVLAIGLIAYHIIEKLYGNVTRT